MDSKGNRKTWKRNGNIEAGEQMMEVENSLALLALVSILHYTWHIHGAVESGLSGVWLTGRCLKKSLKLRLQSAEMS